MKINSKKVLFDSILSTHYGVMMPCYELSKCRSYVTVMVICGYINSLELFTQNILRPSIRKQCFCQQQNQLKVISSLVVVHDSSITKQLSKTCKHFFLQIALCRLVRIERLIRVISAKALENVSFLVSVSGN